MVCCYGSKVNLVASSETMQLIKVTMHALIITWLPAVL